MAPCSRSKPANQPAPAQPAPIEEVINLDILDPSDDEDKDTLPVPTKAWTTSAGGGAQGDETTHVAPIIKLAVKSNRALDIDLVFTCNKNQPLVCKFCK